MRYVSLFSGVEAASVAWEPLGWEPVAFCEVEPFPSAVLAHRFPDVPNLGDIRDVDWSDYGDGSVDLVVGGSPCQSFSVAGGRASLDGESRLMFEYIRAVREIRPRWLLWENVPGVLSVRDNAFGQLLGELSDIGYGLAWRVLDAQFFGVAQRRRRVFLVGCLGGVGRAAAVLFERDSVRGNTSSSREKRQAVASHAAERAGGGSAGFCRGNTSGAGSIGYQREVSPTLRAGERGTNMTPGVVAMQSDGTSSSGHQNGCGYNDDGSAYTLNGVDRQSVAITNYGDNVAGTLAARHDSSPCSDRGQNVVAFAQNTRNEVRLVGGDGSLAGAIASNPSTTKGQGASLVCMLSGQANAEIAEDGGHRRSRRCTRLPSSPHLQRR